MTFRTILLAGIAAVAFGGSAFAQAGPQTGPLVKRNNLSDVPNPATALQNLFGPANSPTSVIFAPTGTILPAPDATNQLATDSFVTQVCQGLAANATSIPGSTTGLGLVRQSTAPVNTLVGLVQIDPVGNMTVQFPAVPVTARAPSLTDDTTKGYTSLTTEMWRAPNDVIYQQVQKAAGQAVWQPMSTVTAKLPIDAVGGTVPLAAYGTRQLFRAYAGKAMNVVRPLDSTALDIGFLPDGSLDTDTLDAFCNTAGAVPCSVAIWYDQSGNANNAIGPINAVPVAATNHQPFIVPGVTIGNSRAIVFPKNADILTANSYYFQMPVGVATSDQALSMAVFARANTLASAGYIQGLDSATGLTSGVALASNGGQTFSLRYNSINQTAPDLMAETPSLVGFAMSAPATSMFVDNTITNGLPGGQATKSIAGGYVGAAAASSNTNTAGAYSAMGAAFVWGRALSTTDVTNLRASVYRTFATAPQIKDVVVLDGDLGINGNFVGGYIRDTVGQQLLNLMPQPATFRLYNAAGVAGGTLISAAVTAIANWAPAAVQAGAANNVVVWFPPNGDIKAGTLTGAQIYSTLVANYVSTAHAAGFRVLLGTMLPRNDFVTVGSIVEATEWAALNVLIRANNVANTGTYGAAGVADGIVDVAGDPTIGPAAAAANATYYTLQGAGYLPTPLAESYIAQYAAAALTAALR